MRLIAVCVLFAALSPVHAQIPVEALSTFKDGANRFSLRYPSAWEVAGMGNPSSCFTALSGTTDRAAEHVQALSLTCQPTPFDMQVLFAGLETDEGMDAFLDGIVAGRDLTVDLIDHARTRVAGRDALRLRYVQTLRMEDGEMPFYSVLHLFSTPTASYTLICGETDGDRAATDAACGQLVRTFAFGSGSATAALGSKPY